jgi:hypothetical protein
LSRVGGVALVDVVVHDDAVFVVDDSLGAQPLCGQVGEFASDTVA